MGQPDRLAAVDPEVLYNKLIAFQSLVADVEFSGRRVSWPLVSYCDAIWQSIFGESSTCPQIFYAAGGEYNYSIRTFSEDVAELLSDLLPKHRIVALVGQRKLYCLNLASLEHTNLPLYANIAHEFGHAVFDAYATEFLRIGTAALGDLLEQIQNDLSTDKQARARRIGIAGDILRALLEEVVADLCGALLAGPAFFCSLDEMAWGSSRTEWQIQLTRSGVRAYPSTGFRLLQIRQWSGLERAAERVANTAASFQSSTLVPALEQICARAPTDQGDELVVLPGLHPDRAALEQVFTRHLPDIKSRLTSYAEGCAALLRARNLKSVSELHVESVDALLVRLEHDVLPNIVPDGTLLGDPADFLSILNASSIFRVHALHALGTAPPERGAAARLLGKIERLTEKALEVSYVQRKYLQARP